MSQAAKILNTVIAAAEEFSQARGGIPLWVFTAYSFKKAKVYKTLSRRLARHLGGEYRVVRSQSSVSQLLSFDVGMIVTDPSAFGHNL